MLNKYDALERLVIIAGYMGTVFVWLSMGAFCILLWYFVFSLFTS